MKQQTCPENRRRGKVNQFGSRGGSRKLQRIGKKKIVEVWNSIIFYVRASLQLKTCRDKITNRFSIAC